ncbi:MAG: diguanylate cyclase [Polyangiaceae bacterium]|nr:diguanylate cyclase [Polyangiaceae bacterium]
MPDLKRGEAKFLHDSVTSFSAGFDRGVVEVLAKELRGVEPAIVRELREQLQLLIRQLESRQSTIRVHEAMLPLLKRVVFSERRRVAEELEHPMAKATDPTVHGTLGRELKRYDDVLTSPLLSEARPLRMPRLTDFLSIRYAAEATKDAPPLRTRVYDEKFHVLEAPALFLPDLAHYRHECALRGADLAVAFVDIDDFKAVNAKLTETVVDKKVLGPFLELLEAWVFSHGHAYRFGGDEYVVLLPNATANLATALLDDLRQRIARSRFRSTEVRLSISTGAVIVDPDCYLTDREILGRANAAKAKAKAVRKGALVVCEPPAWDVDAARVG